MRLHSVLGRASSPRTHNYLTYISHVSGSKSRLGLFFLLGRARPSFSSGGPWVVAEDVTLSPPSDAACPQAAITKSLPGSHGA